MGRLQAEGHLDAGQRYTDAFFADDVWDRVELPNGEIAAFYPGNDLPIEIWLCGGCWTMILDHSTCPTCGTRVADAWTPGP